MNSRQGFRGTTDEVPVPGRLSRLSGDVGEVIRICFFGSVKNSGSARFIS
jgi:hypothetical protein